MKADKQFQKSLDADFCNYVELFRRIDKWEMLNACDRAQRDIKLAEGREIDSVTAAFIAGFYAGGKYDRAFVKKAYARACKSASKQAARKVREALNALTREDREALVKEFIRVG